MLSLIEGQILRLMQGNHLVTMVTMMRSSLFEQILLIYILFLPFLLKMDIILSGLQLHSLTNPWNGVAQE